jgi:hypothetical protein
MTVRQLIKELQKLPQNRQVILQKDAEGNGYSPLAGVDDNASYNGEDVLLQKIKEGYDDEDVGKREDGFHPCVVLFPV